MSARSYSSYTSYINTKLCCKDNIAGPPGATGANGHTGATGAVGNTGATGAVGHTGATGAVGHTGATGAVGHTGATGAVGHTGATGPQGIQGETGIYGPALFTLSQTNTNLSIEPANKITHISDPTNQFTSTLESYSYMNSYVTFRYVTTGGTTVGALSNNVVTQSYTYGIVIDGSSIINIYINNSSVPPLGSATANDIFTIIATNTGAYFYQNGTQIYQDTLITTSPLKALFGSSQVGSIIDLIAFGPVGSGSTGATGPQGETGHTGAVGHTGATGATGARGHTGATGAVGHTGATGHTGAVGHTGAIGHTGATGPFPTPVLFSTGNTGNVVIYDPVTNDWYHQIGKTFIIQHPLNINKYLIHACLEGPENGVYYRGKSEVTNNESVMIQLPEYVTGFAQDFTVNITGIYDGKLNVYNSTEVDANGHFTVYGENGKFHWTVMGKRGNINIEPNKNEVTIKGVGPYTWYE